MPVLVNTSVWIEFSTRNAGGAGGRGQATTTTSERMNCVSDKAVAPALMVERIELFACPACSAALVLPHGHRVAECTACARSFACERGIPLLYWPNDWDHRSDVTEVVKRFYEENPFPNYEHTDSRWSLKQKAERGVFARLMDEQIPHGSLILDVGCGTGQLSNYLGLRWGRTVFGTDLCLNSLTLGQQFKERNGIENVAFFQMNLFRPAFRPESFDFVICNGVLHHTSDPFQGFRMILRLLKKGGFVIIGLYNRYGRVPTDVRRFIFGVTGNRFKVLDPRLGAAHVGETRKHTWFLDQYKHPHESKHSMDEVMDWFRRTDVDFINGIPKPVPLMPLSPDERLFARVPAGSSLSRMLVQLGMLASGGSEGGFFVMIGRKRA
jgi:SAM-dependent methyltransferase